MLFDKLYFAKLPNQISHFSGCLEDLTDKEPYCSASSPQQHELQGLLQWAETYYFPLG